MDIVEFVEKVCNFPLSDYQKEFVRKTYDAAENGKRLYCIPPRGASTFSLEILRAIVFLSIAQRKAMIDKEFIDNYDIEKTFPQPFPYIEKDEERK